MKSHLYDVEDLIRALATPWGESALAVIRTSGPGCIRSLSTVFSFPEKLVHASGHSLVHGWIVDPDTGENIDEVLVSVFRGKASYTGQESAEISCHGGLPVIKRIGETLGQAGFREASPGEFTFRAFVNGKMDLTRAEAVKEIISSRTDRARALAVSRLSGTVYDAVDDIKKRITRFAAAAALALDYPEEESEPVVIDAVELETTRNDLGALLSTFRTGRLYRDGIKTVLAGPANAGKSSLFNLFLKEERSIVTETPGTTRDWLEAWLDLDGIPMRLFDTAGLREGASDPVETEGIRRTNTVLETADVVVYVIDGLEGVTEGDRRRTETYAETCHLITVWNKSDVADPPPEGVLPVSAVTGSGFTDLERRLVEVARDGGAAPAGDAPIIDSLRQKEKLSDAAAALDRFAEGIEGDAVPYDLLAEDLRDALDALGEITGEVTPADILETLFSDFCVGK